MIKRLNLQTPMNLTASWNFGSLLGLMLGSQIMTGLLLSMHYSADVSLAFSSVDHIVRDVNGGWFLRSLHANGASFFFLCIYAHIGRGCFFGSFKNVGAWMTGVVILFLVMVSAFLGYVLPWGQMSLWGATVITSMFSAIPYLGEDLVFWVWGGFSLNNSTLTRFYTLHFVTPMLVAAVVVLHIILLHSEGSSNPLGVVSSADKVPFHLYYTIKDVVGFVAIYISILAIVLFDPNYLGEPDNFIKSNPLVTPEHIVPEWYFLFAYAVLRFIPSKLGGVIVLLITVFILVSLPFWSISSLQGSKFYPYLKFSYYSFILAFFMLSLGGSMPISEPYVLMSKAFALAYFSFFILSRPMAYALDWKVFFKEESDRVAQVFEAVGMGKIVQVPSPSFVVLVEEKTMDMKTQLYLTVEQMDRSMEENVANFVDELKVEADKMYTALYNTRNDCISDISGDLDNIKFVVWSDHRWVEVYAPFSTLTKYMWAELEKVKAETESKFDSLVIHHKETLEEIKSEMQRILSGSLTEMEDSTKGLPAKVYSSADQIESVIRNMLDMYNSQINTQSASSKFKSYMTGKRIETELYVEKELAMERFKSLVVDFKAMLKHPMTFTNHDSLEKAKREGAVLGMEVKKWEFDIELSDWS